jgi:LTXXQ motif family protein
MPYGIISRSTFVALMAGVALGVLSMSNGVMAFGGRGGGGGGGGHFGGGGIGGSHGGGFGGGHIGGFGGGHFGGGHFGGLGGGHFGAAHFGGTHFGGGHFGGGHSGALSGGHFGAAHVGGMHGSTSTSYAHGGLGRDPAAARNVAGHAFAGRNFAALGGGRGFAGRGYWGSYNGYGYGGWAGPVFWPYAYDYMFGYIFSPWPYYDPFWGYGPFNLFAILFWPYAWAPYYADDGFGYYGYDPGLPFTYGDVYGDAGYARTRVARAKASNNRAPADAAAATPADVSGMCSGQAGNLTGLPIDQVDRTVQPTSDQRADLDALKAASAKVSDILAASCPSEIPMTAPSRLAAMENRLDAMRQAVDTVRAPLEKFYGSLSDEQRAHFNAMRVGSEPQATRGRARNRQTVASSAEICRAQTQGYSTAFPEQEIEKSIQLTEAQKAALDELRAAATKAPGLLKDTCPSETPSTPTARLVAVQARLDAMLEAVKTERPAMDKFYSSLTDEQKARFNALRPPQQPTGHEG